jgi:hypothetical protein
MLGWLPICVTILFREGDEVAVYAAGLGSLGIADAGSAYSVYSVTWK